MPKVKKSSKRYKKNKEKFPIKIVLLAIFLAIVVFVLTNRINKSPNKIKPKIATKINKHKTNSILDAIYLSATKLNIPENSIKTKSKKDGTHIYFPINQSVMDLNFANMIITGQVRLTKGTVTDAFENDSANKQTLYITDKSNKKKYVIELYYNTKIYPPQKLELSIIIDDFGGYDNSLLDEFCKLDKAVTFSIIPELSKSTEVMLKAHKTGHEVMLHLPMEPYKYPQNNPGDDAIFVNLSQSEIKRRVNKFLKMIYLADGVNNHMGSLATSDEKTMNAVLDVLQSKNLFFIDSFTSSSSIAYEMAIKRNMRTGRRNLFLDDPSPSLKVLQERVEKLKYYKDKNKTKVIAITHCSNSKRLNQLKRFIIEAKKIGYHLVSASKIVKKNTTEIL
jgi:polysaccharide deacetylase 2 family uncharacterized protein YibQ